MAEYRAALHVMVFRASRSPARRAAACAPIAPRRYDRPPLIRTAVMDDRYNYPYTGTVVVQYR